jgi:ketosteroid isomerase-like protein
MSALTREYIEELYRARLSRDAVRLEPFIDDQVDWLISGPIELLPYCGQRLGKAEVIDTITRVMPSIMHVTKLELQSLLIDRNRAASFNRLTGVLIANGRVISYNQAQFMTFRAGRIVEYRSLIDSFDAAEQMIGHPIALNDTHCTFTSGERIAV